MCLSKYVMMLNTVIFHNCTLPDGVAQLSYQDWAMLRSLIQALVCEVTVALPYIWSVMNNCAFLWRNLGTLVCFCYQRCAMHWEDIHFYLYISNHPHWQRARSANPQHFTCSSFIYMKVYVYVKQMSQLSFHNVVLSVVPVVRIVEGFARTFLSYTVYSISQY